MTETKPKRRWFRFSLRTLFVLVTIVGAAIWVIQQLNWIHQRHEFLTQHHPSCKDGIAPLSLRIFGETGYHSIVLGPGHLDSNPSKLFPEASIYIE
jgi:hypothetical protein